MYKKLFFLFAFILVLSFLNYAQVPQMINYQGLLSDASGTALNGSYSIEFKIYDSPTGGTVLWSETQTVIVVDGLFDVLLGSVTPIPYSVFDGADKYLSLKVGSDSEMTPRKRLVSIGYSLRAYEADKLDGKDAADFVQSGQENSVSTNMLQDNAVTTDKIAPKVLSSLSGVSNDGGNVNLVAGDNVTITPDDENNEITIAATAGPGGDNLGNHTATQNLNMNSHWVSGDGENEGIFVQPDGVLKLQSKNTNRGLSIDPTLDIYLTDGVELKYYDNSGDSHCSLDFEKERIQLRGEVYVTDTLKVNGPAKFYGSYIGEPTLFLYHGGSGTPLVVDKLNTYGYLAEFKIAGNHKVVIESSGKVGIGISNPEQKLHVNGTTQMNGFKMPTGAADNYVLTSDANGIGTWQPVSASGDNLGNHTATQNVKLNGHWLSGDGADEGVFVKNNGNVGIGVSDPGSRLSVDGNIYSEGTIRAKWSLVAEKGYLVVGNSNTSIAIR